MAGVDYARRSHQHRLLHIAAGTLERLDYISLASELRRIAQAIREQPVLRDGCDCGSFDGAYTFRSVRG